MSAPPTIRPAAPEDRAAMARIFNASRNHAACFGEVRVDAAEFAALVDGEEAFVAEIDRTVVGFVGVIAPARFVHRLYVDPPHQRRGIGAALLRRCAETYGVPLSLKCDVVNTAGFAFYQHLGWVAANRGVGDFGLWIELELRSKPSELGAERLAQVRHVRPRPPEGLGDGGQDFG